MIVVLLALPLAAAAVLARTRGRAATPGPAAAVVGPQREGGGVWRGV